MTFFNVTVRPESEKRGQTVGTDSKPLCPHCRAHRWYVRTPHKPFLGYEHVICCESGPAKHVKHRADGPAIRFELIAQVCKDFPLMPSTNPLKLPNTAWLCPAVIDCPEIFEDE